MKRFSRISFIGRAVKRMDRQNLKIWVLLGLCLLSHSRMTQQFLPVIAAAEDFVVEVAPTVIPMDAEDVFMQVEVIRDAPAPAKSGKILLYHTHTYEAYAQIEEDPYQQTEKWRTKDERHNVTAVGRALAASLRALGFDVTHDTTAFEPPNLDDAYDRSLKMLEERTAAGETYDLYIDLHRDAIANSTGMLKTVNIGGEEVARFMVLVGKGTSGGYTEKPDWEANLAIANRITASLNSQCAAMCRDVKIKTGRFNQHIAPQCILIECGMNTNTLSQVMAGVPYLAQAIADAIDP